MSHEVRGRTMLLGDGAPVGWVAAATLSFGTRPGPSHPQRPGRQWCDDESVASPPQHDGVIGSGIHAIGNPHPLEHHQHVLHARGHRVDSMTAQLAGKRDDERRRHHGLHNVHRPEEGEDFDLPWRFDRKRSRLQSVEVPRRLSVSAMRAGDVVHGAEQGITVERASTGVLDEPRFDLGGVSSRFVVFASRSRHRSSRRSSGFPRSHDRSVVPRLTSRIAPSIILARSAGSGSGVQRRSSLERNSHGRTVDTTDLRRDGYRGAADRARPAVHRQPGGSVYHRNQSIPRTSRSLRSYATYFSYSGFQKDGWCEMPLAEPCC